MKSEGAIAGTDLDPGLWSGKRRSRRVPLALGVACRGVGREVYPGRTVDVSRGGMLLGLTFAAFRSVVNASSIVELTSCVMSLFPRGIDVEFLGRDLRAKAHVVRVVLDLKAAYPLLVGCRFEPILGESECAALGVPISIDETAADGPRIADASNDLVPLGAAPAGGPAPATSAQTPPQIPTTTATPESTPAPLPTPAGGAAGLSAGVAASGRAIAVHLFPAWSQLGARCSGRLVTVAGQDAVVLLTAPAGEADGVGWACGLGARVRATLLDAGAVVGDVRARVVRIDAAGPGEARVTLALARPLVAA